MRQWLRGGMSGNRVCYYYMLLCAVNVEFNIFEHSKVYFSVYNYYFWQGFELDHPVHGGYGWGSPTPRRQSNCQTKKIRSGVRHQDELTDRRRSQCNFKLNLRHCTANYIPVLSSERAPYMKNKESNCHLNKLTSGHLLQKGQDTKTNWPTDRRS
jgi:hypothetical protein